MSPFAGTCGERGAAEGTPLVQLSPLQALVEREDVVLWAPGALPGWAAQAGHLPFAIAGSGPAA